VPFRGTSAGWSSRSRAAGGGADIAESDKVAATRSLERKDQVFSNGAFVDKTLLERKGQGVRPIILGAVQREDWDKVRATARHLWQYPYWDSFQWPEHLAGWLLTNHHCGYCHVDLTDVHIRDKRAHTDHLLPHSKYKNPALKLNNMMNAVAACDDCNWKKMGWDPNKVDPIYKEGHELTYAMRLELIERTKRRLLGRTRPIKIPREESMERCRAAAIQAEEDLA